MFKAITSPNISQHHSQTPDVTRVSAFEPATAHYLSHNLFRPIIKSRETISVMNKKWYAISSNFPPVMSVPQGTYLVLLGIPS